MGTQEIQELINQYQAELDAELAKYDTEKAGIDRKISEIQQAIEFNKNQANEIRRTGGDELTAKDFENKVVTMKQEMETQESDMRMALERKKQNISAIKSRLEQQSAKYDDAEDREKVMNLIATAIRYGTG